MVLEAGERVDLNTIDALKNTLFNVGIVFPQLPQQKFDFLTLAVAHTVTGGVPFLRKAAGTLQKLQVVVILPCDDRVLMYAVQRPNQLHTGEVFAAELRRHGL